MTGPATAESAPSAAIGVGLQMVEAPAFMELASTGAASSGEEGVDDRTTSTAGDTETIEQLLVLQLRDLLHAEGQLVKALPEMVKAARSERLTLALENHLEETKQQAERLKEGLALVGVQAKAKPCKGMAGLITEGEEVIEEGEECQTPLPTSR